MDGLQITLISAYTGYPTTNRAAITNSSTLYKPFELYSSLTPPSQESGPTTSSNCCTFQLEEFLPLQVEGTCAALSSLSDYVLKGVLDGTTILETGSLPVPSTKPIFAVPTMELTWVNGIPPFPCRIGGSVIWQIFPAGADSKSQLPFSSPLPFAEILVYSTCGVDVLWYTTRDVFRMGRPSRRTK